MKPCINCAHHIVVEQPAIKSTEHRCTHSELRNPVTDEDTCCHENRSSSRRCGRDGRLFEGVGDVR